MVNEISAELLLEYLYPELEQKWTVRHKGTFYRNYNADVMHVYADDHLIELSRDGFLRLLPPALLSAEDELSDPLDKLRAGSAAKRPRLDKTTRMKQIQLRLHTIQEAFMPFDTFAFRQRLMLERETQVLLNLKLAIVLKEYYDIDLDSIADPYVSQAAVLLPYVSRLRGDIGFIGQLLEELTGYPVRTRRSAFSSTDNTRCWMPKVHYDIIVPGLSQQQYLTMTDKLQPLIEFLTEHFIPFDCFSEIAIKAPTPDTRHPAPLLNYNTHVQ